MSFTIDTKATVANSYARKQTQLDALDRVTSKMMATTLEAIIGAIYEDGGDVAVKTAVARLGFLDPLAP